MAWWLLHEELNGTMDETYPIKENGMSGISTQKHDKSYYDFDRNKPPVYPADHPSQQFWHGWISLGVFLLVGGGAAGVL